MTTPGDPESTYTPIWAQPPPDPGRPDFADPAPSFPAPSGVPTIEPRAVHSTRGYTTYPDAPEPQPAPRRGPNAPTVVAVAALTALIVGGSAGIGGFLVADRVAQPTTTASPSASAASPSGDPSGSASPAGSSSPVPSPNRGDTVAIAAAVLPATVTIQAREGNRGSTGSGFVIDADKGLIMTNNHVVELGENGDLHVVLSNGSRSRAQIVGRSPSYDIAVIKIDPPKSLTAVRIGDSDATDVGETVIAFGSPLGLGGTVTQGIVSAKERPVAVGGSDDDPNNAKAYSSAIQTDAPINPGNSGGPLVDASGRVVGVDSVILTLGSSDGGQGGNIGLGFAIPINQAMQIGTELIKSGVATYPVLGADVDDVRTADAVELSGLTSGGPASRAGLRGGDRVTAMDGKRVTDAVDLIVRIRTHRPGEQVRIGYDRDGASRTATVTLGKKEG